MNSGVSHSTVGRRGCGYVATALLLVIAVQLLTRTKWRGSPAVHTHLEIVVTVLALIVGGLALIRFYSKKDKRFLLIGAGFLGAGLLDACHAVLSAPGFADYSVSPPAALVPWSGIASRLCLSVLLWLRSVRWTRKLARDGHVREALAYFLVAVWTCACAFLFLLKPLPLGYTSFPVFHRPQDLLPALFFFFALLGSLRRGKWRRDAFEHWLVISIIVAIAHSVCLSTSARLYDAMYIGSHVLKVISYICVLSGLGISMYHLFVAEETIVAERTEELQNEIAERKRAQELSQGVIEALPVLICIFDASGKILLRNSSYQKILGYSNEEIAAASALSAVAEEDRERVQQLIEQIFKEGSGETEASMQRKDGTKVPCLLSGVRLVVDGKPCLLGVALDISNRKRAEAAMTEAKEAAESANRAKGEFLANMSHELRTPLNGILGMTELSLDTQLTSEQREYLGMVKSSAESLLTVINDILDFSKIEAGKMDFENIQFNLRQSLETTLKMLALRAHEKGLELNCDVADGLPEIVVGDPTRLRQILLNLVGNAIRFTEHGEVSVHVQQDSSDNGRITLHFIVSDTGIGIPADQQEKIFEAFAQADGSMSRRFGGSGLGLAVSRRLVKAFQGRIWVESVLGEGSAFHFTASLGIGQELCRTIPARDLEGISTLVVRHPPLLEHRRTLHILLAEDNLVNRMVAVRMLEKHGYTVEVANDGRQAVAKLRFGSFDLVLMDVQMPEINGFQATAFIREKEKSTGGHIPVIAITAHAFERDRERCLAAGMDGYISKPFHLAELLSEIERLAQLTGMGQSAESC